jgi:hypothetical protein
MYALNLILSFKAPDSIAAIPPKAPLAAFAYNTAALPPAPAMIQILDTLPYGGVQVTWTSNTSSNGFSLPWQKSWSPTVLSTVRNSSSIAAHGDKRIYAFAGTWSGEIEEWKVENNGVSWVKVGLVNSTLSG